MPRKIKRLNPNLMNQITFNSLQDTRLLLPNEVNRETKAFLYSQLAILFKDKMYILCNNLRGEEKD